MTRFCLPLLTALAAAPLPVAANPLEGVVTLDMRPGWRTDAGTHMAGLTISLAPGWKTYWRAPGDAGIPPSFDWSGSQNVSGVSFHWPVPEVFHQNGMRSIGYEGRVTIPMEFALTDPASPARIEGQVQLGVCEEICVPVTVAFSAELPAAGARDAQITAALLDRPRTEAEAGVGGVTCAITPTEDGLQVTTRIDMDPVGRSEIVVIEAGNQQVWVSEPQSWREGGDLLAQADMIHVSGGMFAFDRSQVRITVLGQGVSVDIQGCTGG